jgi:RNA polymerase sigma-70 factor, ECF subfamily
MEKRNSATPQAWFLALYERHFDFVWRSLRHLGVREADLSDACQDVFVVVYRHFPSFEPRGKVTTWLFQICLNRARERRRRAHVRSEVLGDEALEHAAESAGDPHGELERQDKLALFEAALASMDLDQRAAFILFEIEGMTGPEAAAAMDVPLGTAYSRLRLARKVFVAAAERAQKGSAYAPVRRGAVR